MNDFEDRLRDRMHGLRASVDPPPGLWAKVEARANSRRWIPIAMAAVAAAVLLLALIAGVGSSNGPKPHVVAAESGVGQDTTTTGGESGDIAAPPTSQPADTTTPSSTTTSVGQNKTATTRSTRGPVPTTMAVPTPQATTTTEIANCTSQDVSLATTTDKASYTQGETVHISVTATNTSSHPCQIPQDCGVTPEGATVTDAKGRAVWAAPHAGVACTNPPPPPTVLQPGQSTQPRSFAQFDWNEEDCPAPPDNCPGTQVPAGAYAAKGTWRFSDGTVTGQPTDFRIT